VWYILSIWPYSIRELYEELEKLRAEGFIKPSGRGWSEIEVTEQGSGEGQLLTDGARVCSQCGGRGVTIPSGWLERFRSLVEMRPLPVAAYDQGFMRIEDALARVVFMHRMGDVAARDVLVVGDDDLISLALAVTGLARRIVVLDVDERLEEFIEKTSRDENFPIEFRRVDLRHPLPPDLMARFDTFITDPVETRPGIELFLSRAVSSLRGRYSAGYFGLTTLEASLTKWHAIQSLLLRMNLVITDVLRDFSIYPEKENRWQSFYASYQMMSLFDIAGSLPDTDWYRSSFIRVEAVAHPQPTITGPSVLTHDELYFDEETLATPRW
jgi:hypothetical protein